MVLDNFLKTRRPLASAVRSQGLRMTRQRQVIVNVLQTAGEHLDAMGVWRVARKQLPGLDLATVYRTLASMKKLGIIDELDLMHYKGTGHFYEARTERDHLHFTCKQCGGVAEIQTPLFETLKTEIQNRYKLRIRVARLEMGGLCKACAGGKVTERTSV